MQARSFRYRSASSHQKGLDALYLSGKLVALGAFKLHPRPDSNAFSKIQGALNSGRSALRPYRKGSIFNDK
jgi:hypothetical protein